MISIFEMLGIYGLEQDKEDAILSSLLTGDPVLLIGRQGTAKTALIEAIGSAFHEASKRRFNNVLKAKGNVESMMTEEEKEIFSFHIYDASKINFEDLIGFPNPEEMKKGKMSFIKSPMTAWGKKLIGFDEFNRQEPARQNNIFELIRSRRLQGMDTGTVWIMNAMNPYGMAGTEELDEALVDRHQWFIYVSNFVEMSDVNQERIVKHIGGSDAIGLREWANLHSKYEVNDGRKPNEPYLINETLANAGEIIQKMMVEASKKYQQLSTEVGDPYSWFISRYWKSVTTEMQGKPWKVELSGRRAGMLLRALLAFRAVDLTKCDMDSSRTCRNLQDMFKSVIKMTIPIGIANAGNGIDSNALNSLMTNVDIYSSFFKAGKDGKKARTALDAVYELLTTNELSRKVELLMSDEADEVAKNTIWSTILNSLKNDLKSPEDLRNAITLGIVAHIMTVKPNAVPLTMQASIAKHSSKILKLNELCENISITGQFVMRINDITKIVESYDNIFTRLQCKLLFEIACKENKDVDLTNDMFNNICDSIKLKCSQLSRLLDEKKIDSMKVKSITPAPTSAISV
jgi:hypothetical protein